MSSEGYEAKRPVLSSPVAVPAALAAIAVGCLVLVGWALHIPRLTSLLPGFVTMKPNTALCFVLAGLALALRVKGKATARVADLCAIVVALVGALTLAEYLAGVNLGLDQLLFPEPAGAAETVHPGRMALPTAFGFLLLGAAILLLGTRRGPRIAPWPTWAVVVIAGLGLVGYLYDLPSLTRFGPFTAIALPTALTLLALSVGILAATPTPQGAARRPPSPLAGFLGAIALLMITEYAVHLHTNRQERHVAQLRRTETIKGRLVELLSMAKDVETGVRGYLIAGDPLFLESYHSALEDNSRLVQSLRSEIRDPAQSERLMAMERRLHARISFQAGLVALGERGDFAAAAALVRQSEGRRLMDRVRRDIAAMLKAEDELIAEQATAVALSSRKVMLAHLVGVLASLGILLAVFTTLSREIAARRRLEEELRRANDGLEERVRARTAELKRSNRSLRMLSDCNQALIRATDEKELLQAICDVIVNSGGLRFSCTYFAERDEAKTLRPQAWAGDGKDRPAPDALTWADAGGGRDPAGTAVRTGEPAVIDDLADHPDAGRWREEIRRLGLASVAAFPLKDAAGTIGALTVSSVEANVFRGEELRLLTELADDLSFGIATIRARAAQRLADEELHRSQATLQAALASMSDAVFISDAAGRFVEFNNAFATFHKFSDKAQCLKTLAEYPDILEVFMANGEVAPLEMWAVPRALRGETVAHAEYSLRRKDTGETWIGSYSFSPIRDKDGVIVGSVVVGQDITERKRAEAEILRLNADLEQRVRERTAQLEEANAGLHLAREEAERANRAKSEFLSRMSHELRTPLNAILGFAQLMELEALPEASQGRVRQVLKAGRHLLELINEILDIARIEAGRLALSLEPVSVREVIGESLELIRPLAGQRRIALEAGEDCRGSANVLADRQRLKQILLNLLANAVKYIREGGRVTVGCEAAGDGSRLRIAVHDTGPGIPAAQLGRLFQPFERLTTAQDKVPGTGLGLALSKGLAEAMGGVIGVASEVDRGSTFWIELPIAESQATRVERTSPLAQMPQRAESRPRTVLYVEDNLSNLDLVESILALRPGVTLIPCMQGRLALELVREHCPDLVLLDLHLPDLGGEEVLRLLRENATTRDIPVVVLSADASPQQPGRLKAAGAREYLTKPIDVRRFLEVLDEQLAGGGGERCLEKKR